MRILFAAMMIAGLAGPAYAQDKPLQRYGETDKGEKRRRRNRRERGRPEGLSTFAWQHPL